MTIEITTGWWIAPLAVTIAAFIARWYVHKDEQPSYGYAGIGDGIGRAFTFFLALTITLASWLIWALLT